MPLSGPALAVLREVTQFGTPGVIFPGKKAATLSERTLLAAVHTAGGNGASVHGFRSSFRDWAAECTNFPREICEAALAHAPTSRVEAAYQRGDLLERRRTLMARWGEFRAAPPVAGEVVVPLRA